MSRPTNKTDLIIAANKEFEKLWTLIDSLSQEEQTIRFTFEDRDKNLRDILTHLHEWHKMMEKWHKVGTLEGGNPAVPGDGYTWRTLPSLNLIIWENYQDTSLEESKKLLKKSHKKILKLIESHTNEELFTKSVYKWTKSTSLGAYFVSNTSSHYNWAMKKIKLHKRSLN